MTELQHAGFRSSLALKLALAMAVSTALFFLVFGYLNLRLDRQHSEEMVLQSADRISDLIRRSTHYQMLRNDREALYHVIRTIGAEPGIRRIRIFNEEGRISVSTDPAEVNTFVDKRAEACYGCHAPEARTGQPLAKLARNDRARIFTDAQGQRVLGVIRPIENEPACSNAACHAHPPDRRVLGVIDTDLSLATVDARLAEHQAHLTRFTGLILLLITGVSMVFIWLVVYRPVRELRAGTQRLAAGDLSYRLPVRSADELGELASSFNKMAGELADARANLTAWARTLETRVEEKTRALERAHEHAVQMEKMASVGRLAAVVAHEINNPLSGILTYTKLLKKWLGQNELDAARREEVRSSLELVECESRRCGEIVRNLLTFARAAPMNLEWSDLNAVVERAIKLLQHQLDLAGVQLQTGLAEKLPPVRCDASQIEQVLLALMMNAADAMPRGGILWLRSKKLPDAAEVRLEVQDDGLGIPADVLPHIFEPFFTTKENKRSVGLGLAVSHGIVQRHGGRIEVESEPGRGTKFTVILPLQLESTQADKEPQASRPVSEVHQHA
jgi:two-component system NtrC family sensor kinase